MSPTGERFNFLCVGVDYVSKEIKKLSQCRAAKINDIPVKILKQNADIFSDNICNFFSFCLS